MDEFELDLLDHWGSDVELRREWGEYVRGNQKANKEYERIVGTVDFRYAAS